MPQQVNIQTLIPECSPVVFEEEYNFEKGLASFIGRALQIFLGKTGFWITGRSGRKFFLSTDKLVKPLKGKDLLMLGEDLSRKEVIKGVTSRINLFEANAALNRSTFKGTSLDELIVDTINHTGGATGTSSLGFKINLATAKEFKTGLPIKGLRINLDILKDLRESGLADEIPTTAGLFREFRQDEQILRMILRRHYDHTQDVFSSLNVTQVPAYRGMAWYISKSSGATSPKWRRTGTFPRVETMNLNPINPFSISPKIAEEYANSFDTSFHSVVLSANVPAKQILNMPFNSFGAGEGELTVLGPTIDALIQIAGVVS